MVGFCEEYQDALVPQIDDRPLDQYLSFRDEVMTLVENERFLVQLNEAWMPFHDSPSEELMELQEIRQLLLAELTTFPRMVEVAQAVGNSDEIKGWRKSMLDRASTVCGSVQDIIENLPPYVKHGLTLFKELIDLFKG